MNQRCAHLNTHLKEECVMVMLTESIVYIWLLPVVLQIVLPLFILVVWLVKSLFSSFVKQEKISSVTLSPAVDNLGKNPA